MNGQKLGQRLFLSIKDIEKVNCQYGCKNQIDGQPLCSQAQQRSLLLAVPNAEGKKDGRAIPEWVLASSPVRSLMAGARFL